MASLNFIVVMINLSMVWSVISLEYFVSKNGSNDELCGNKVNPCGTLYQVSLQIDQSSTETYEMYIMDGQNETEIINHHILNDTSHYNPCLPIPLDGPATVTITFNPHFIHDLNDWFPLDLCHNNSYKNEYFFVAQNIFTINNLIIDHYDITIDDNLYGYVKVSNYKRDGRYVIDAAFVCNNCTFKSISSLQMEKAMFNTTDDIQLYHNVFIDIQTTSPILLSQTDFLDQSIIIHDSTFTNIISESHLIHQIYTSKDFDKILHINRCTFENISVDYMIYDETTNAMVYIMNSNINIISGLVYVSQHRYDSDIVMDNITLISNETHIENQMYNALLYFVDSDTTNITSMNILYEYDTANLCYEYPSYPAYQFGIISRSLYYCKNPVTAISNHGLMNIESLSIDMDSGPYEANISNYKGYVFEVDDFSNLVVLIENHGTMHMEHITIKRSISSALILNDDAQLSIMYFSFDTSFIANYNPNNLHSMYIIYHRERTRLNKEPMLLIDNSYFYGSYCQLYAEFGGYIQIMNSVFEMTSIAIEMRSIDDFVMMHSTVLHTGVYHSRITPDYYLLYLYFRSVVDLYDTGMVIMSNNSISGYTKGRLLQINANHMVILNGNTFNIDDSGYDLFYNVPERVWSFASPVSFFRNHNARIIGNYFDVNSIDPTVPWIRFFENDGEHCLSGNTFTNYAFDAQNTDITSCLRPNLFQLVTNGTYGYIEESLMDDIGYFIIYNDVEFDAFLSADDSVVVLDNFIIMVMEPHPVIVSGDNVTFLFVDSYVDEYQDISYDCDHCAVITNNRLFDDEQYVSVLMIECAINNESFDSINKTITSSNTAFVSYSVAMKINFVSHTSTYYPGQLLQFDYDIMDNLGHIIPNNSSFHHEIMVQVENDVFSTQIKIDSDGKCGACNTGSLINAISITNNGNNQSIGDVFSMNISIPDHILIAQYSTLSLEIVGCPIGYGPDSNNFTCMQCQNGYYNLMRNNLAECKTCDMDSNYGIQCNDGNIHILHDYWMNLQNDSIKSAQCTMDYCCQQADGCDYLLSKPPHLCAPGRDPLSPLCGKCKEGYSESINSAECIKCDQSFYPRYLLYPCILSMFILSIIIGINIEKANLRQYPPIKPNSFNYLKLMLKLMLLKNITYYEQGCSQLLSAAFKSSLYSVSTVSNLSIAFRMNTPWCFIDGLTAKQKILLDLGVAVIILFMIVLLWLVHYLCIECKRNGKMINFAKLFLTTYVIMVGSVISVLFRLLNCKHIGDRVVHYYFGNEECYGKTWWTAFIVLMVIFISFVYLLVTLSRMSATERQNRNQSLNRMVNKYKPQYYYWEFVLFLRRVTIALFAVSVNHIIAQFLFIGIIFVFLFIHNESQPFIIHEANQMEFILLSAFVVIIVAQVQFSMKFMFLDILLSTLIVAPYALLIFYIVRVIKRKYSKAKIEQEFAQISEIQNLETMV